MMSFESDRVFEIGLSWRRRPALKGEKEEGESSSGDGVYIQPSSKGKTFPISCFQSLERFLLLLLLFSDMPLKIRVGWKKRAAAVFKGNSNCSVAAAQPTIINERPAAFLIIPVASGDVIAAFSSSSSFSSSL